MYYRGENMENYIIMPSMTKAFRARDLLMQHRIMSYVKRKAGIMNTGCVFALFIKNDFNKALQILEVHGLYKSGQAFDDIL